MDLKTQDSENTLKSVKNEEREGESEEYSSAMKRLPLEVGKANIFTWCGV